MRKWLTILAVTGFVTAFSQGAPMRFIGRYRPHVAVIIDPGTGKHKTLPEHIPPFIETDPYTVRPFVPVGVNYFDHETGWAPKIWHKFDEKRVRRHLKMLSEKGFNTIRVFLTYDSFHREPGQVHSGGEAKFRKLIGLCREFGLYVIPSGPDHWEGTPAYRKDKDGFADESVLSADEAWWREFAAKFKDEPAILAWDLLNEPMIGWESPAMREKWNAWLENEYGTAAHVASAWGRPVDQVGQIGRIPVVPAEPARNDARLFDYQRFREHVGDEWTRRITAAIRSGDPNHMITIGHIQWVAPVYLMGVRHYAGFHLKANARHLDFMTVHFYPIESPRPCDADEGIAVNRAYLEALLFQCSVGKPLMIGEFNWYGGGGLEQKGFWHLPAKPVEHQVQWCRELLAVSRGRVAGWLNWAFADTPSSTDITRWSGLWTEDLRLKPWGDLFGRFAREVAARPDPPRAFRSWLHTHPVEHRALVTDPETGHAFRRELRQVILEGDIQAAGQK